MQWGIFNSESADYSEEEAIEAGFYSMEEALAAVQDRYSEDDDIEIHPVEEAEAEEDD